MVRPARGASARIRAAGESPRQAASVTSAATATVLGNLFMTFEYWRDVRTELPQFRRGRYTSGVSMRVLGAVVAALILAAIALVFGKRHARRFQRERKIHIDRFKLKRRHAAIELEVFGSREVVDAIRTYAKENHTAIEEASKRAHQYLQEIVPKFNLLPYYRFGAPTPRAIRHF